MQTTGEITNTILSLGVAIFLIAACVIFIKPGVNEDFDNWFNDVLTCAPSHGYSDREVDLFEECEWEIYYRENKTPQEALVEHSSRKHKL